MTILKLGKGLILFAKIKKPQQLKMFVTLQGGGYRAVLYYSKQTWLLK